MNQMYTYIDQVLGSYFGSSVGHSEEEAMSILRKHIASSIALSQGLRAELEVALEDSDYSWKGALLRHDVLCIDEEDKARAYARRILWDSLCVA